MNKRNIITTTLAICILSVATIALQYPFSTEASGGPSTVVNVTTTVFDFDAFGAPFLTRSDDKTGLGKSTYSTAKAVKGAGSLVSSQITADGQWQLSLSSTSTRSVWITPDSAVDPSQPAAPPAGYYTIQKAYSVCRDASGNTVPFPNLVNGSGDCSFAINFHHGGILYKLLMRPGALDNTSCPAGGCPLTGKAKVVCNTASSNRCINWTITPNQDTPKFGVVNLYTYTGPRGAEWVYVGQYHNTFQVNVSNP